MITLTFKVFGYAVAEVHLDLNQDHPLVPALAAREVGLIDGGIEKVSDWWVGRMLKKRRK